MDHQASLTRRERRRDYLQSIRAEVVAVWKQLSGLRDPEPAIDDLKKRFDDARAANTTYDPIVVLESGVTVFPSLISELVYLQEDEIAVVVSFYRQLTATAKLGDFLQAYTFDLSDSHRKEQLYCDYIRGIGQVVAEAETVLALVDPRLRIAKRRQLDALIARLQDT